MTRCYNSDRRAADEEYLEQLKLQLTALQSALLSAGTVESYRFDDGAGSQQVRNSSVLEIRKEIMNLKTEIEWYERKLGCGLNCNIRLRRRLYQGRYR